MRGKVWRIVQINDETGTVHVVPAEDPSAAVPGWDGEILPVPFGVAQQTGEMREKIGILLKEGKKPEVAAEQLAVELKTDKGTLLDAAVEIDEHLRTGAPLPTQNSIVVEVLDRYIIVHACFGEIVNRTLGGIFDSVLSEREAITGWWADGYRILIETTHKLSRQEIEGLPKELFNLTDERVDEAFLNYVNSKFPFVSRMKAIAERFGAMPRGKTLAMSERGEKLKAAFEGTPIYDETLREAMMDKVDIAKTKQIIRDIKDGKITVTSVEHEKASPLAYHILMQYADTAELMAPEHVILSNIDRMKHSIETRAVNLLCMNCGIWTKLVRIKDLPDEPQCGNCNSRLLTVLYHSQDSDKLKADLQKRREGKELTPEELKELSNSRRKADLVLSYGKQAVRALQVKGVGPETASRILGKMHPQEEQFYMDLLKAKIQYLRTREFWDK
jgi:ATP-dependent Lhr-like helicase